MILVDTSVWIHHFRDGDLHLERLLCDGVVLCHTYIIGELACGNIKNRKEIISLLQALPMAPQIEFDEYLYFIEKNQLSGKGIGFVDIHLLAWYCQRFCVKFTSANFFINGRLAATFPMGFDLQ